jgi:starch synthase
VSPTYAHEIQTPEFGGGFAPLLAARAESLSGILNGVDYRIWDPAHDPHIAQRYNADDLSGKAVCKAALRAAFGVSGAPEAPLFGLVGRLTEQKGVDLLPAALEGAFDAGASLVILGSGEPSMEQLLQAWASRHPSRVGVRVEFDEALAHAVEAGADIFLMPSRFEPCGLNQLYALRYGSVPVVAAVGGLADSVTDAGQVGVDRGQTTGFAMRRFLPTALSLAIGKAMAVYPINPLWQALQRNGMRQDFSWTKSAERYTALYSRLASSAA